MATFASVQSCNFSAIFYGKEAIEDLCLNGKIPGKTARGGRTNTKFSETILNASVRTIIDRARQRKDLGVLRSSLNAK